ncbi:MAG: SurA N-terminal domain-containing protein [Bacteroidales bacterium]|nr:SurA N-terminal domain-containing protein [Bacteroidales bacterium]
MGTFETLRKRAGLLLAVVIGLAMLSFILGDFLSSGQAFFGGPEKQIVAVVYDNEIERIEFDERVSKAEEIAKLFSNEDISSERRDEIRDEEWDRMIRDYLFKASFEDLGILVSSPELNSYFSVTNPHPIIRQFFSNPNKENKTGPDDFDAELMVQYINFIKEEQTEDQAKSTQEDAKQRFFYVTEQITESRKIEKYFDLVAKGSYPTSLEVKRAIDEKNNSVSFRVIREYVKIVDTVDQIQVTDAEVKAYYEENKNNYYRMYNEAEIDYVVFDIIPTESDHNMSIEAIEKRKEYFKNSLNDAEEVNSYNSDEFKFEGVYYKQGELPYNLDTFMFSGKKGDVMGPYLENNAYKLAKISDLRDMPDTVRARHIVINEGDQQKTFYMADSLMKLLKANEAEFMQQALLHSKDDFTKMSGGDLGWFNTKSIPALAMSLNNDFTYMKQMIDSAFLKEKGEFYLAGSPLGIHIVQITDKGIPVKKVLPAILVKEVIPHTETIEKVFQQANKFASTNNSKEKFEKAIEEEGLQKRYAKLFEQNRTIPQLEEGRNSPRDIIRWAFNEATPGKVSGVFLLKDRCVVAKLVTKETKGPKKMSELNIAELEYGAKLKKKTELRSKELQAKVAGKSMEEISAILDSAIIMSIPEANFADLRMQGLPSDAILLAHVLKLEPNKVSKPIISGNTIYFVEVIEKKTNDIANADEQKATLKSNAQRVITNNLIKFIEEAANIQDNRIKYY